jgi:hypothetical protein
MAPLSQDEIDEVTLWAAAAKTHPTWSVAFAKYAPIMLAEIEHLRAELDEANAELERLRAENDALTAIAHKGPKHG